MTGNLKNLLSLCKGGKIPIERVACSSKDKHECDKNITKDGSSVSGRYRNKVYLGRLSSEFAVQERVRRGLQSMGIQHCSGLSDCRQLKNCPDTQYTCCSLKERRHHYENVQFTSV